MPTFSKNLQKFFVFFFTAISIIVVIMGIARIKKSPVAVDTGVPPIPEPPLSPAQASNSVTYKGKAFQTPWGSAIASVTVKDGKVIAATMPTVPNSPPSQYAEPYLVQQALSTGSANIQGVSGATYTSLAFKSSLESALAQAKAQGQTITGGTVTPGATSAQTMRPIVPRNYQGDDADESENEGGENQWDD